MLLVERLKEGLYLYDSNGHTPLGFNDAWIKSNPIGGFNVTVTMHFFKGRLKTVRYLAPTLQDASNIVVSEYELLGAQFYGEAEGDVYGKALPVYFWQNAIDGGRRTDIYTYCDDDSDDDNHGDVNVDNPVPEGGEELIIENVDEYLRSFSTKETV